MTSHAVTLVQVADIHIVCHRHAALWMAPLEIHYTAPLPEKPDPNLSPEQQARRHSVGACRNRVDSARHCIYVT